MTRSGTVAIVGWTNVGKSTLLNRLVGEKIAAVADVAQTTRHRVRGILTDPERGQIVFVDTPGFHAPKYRMNRAMVRAAVESAKTVDAVVWVFDAAHGIGPGDRRVRTMLEQVQVPRIAVLNKVDVLRTKARLLPMIADLAANWGFHAVVPTSALDGEGCAGGLVDEVFRVLPEGPPLFPEDVLTDQPARVLAAEYVREKLLESTRQEIPHATAVVVDRWEDGDDGVTRIEASVLVERESQKAIVIGRGGGVLKRVGTEARLELEEMLGQRVFLKLWVRVARDWRNDRAVLNELGIEFRDH